MRHDRKQLVDDCEGTAEVLRETVEKVLAVCTGLIEEDIEVWW